VAVSSSEGTRFMQTDDHRKVLQPLLWLQTLIKITAVQAN
jgi:hypothetical protein